MEHVKEFFAGGAGRRPQGRRRQRQAHRHRRPRDRPHAILRRPQLPRHAAPEDGAEPASSRANPLRRHDRSGEGAGRRARAHPQGRAEERLHDPLPDPGRARRRAVPRRRQGPLQGRADRRGHRRKRGGRARGGGEGEGRIRGAAGRLRRRGGAEARRAAGQRVPRPELLQIRGPPLPPRPPRRRREGLRDGRPCDRGALPVLADRACADRDDRLHRRAGRERPLHLLFQHAGAVLHARQHRAHPRTRRSRSCA